MKRIAIIDDEPDACFTLRRFLTQLCPDVEIVGEADSVASGYLLLRQTKPDAVLLDISMEDGSGFDLLDKFQNPPFKVIFTTAHDEFALKAFRYHAMDYLLKPIDPDELVETVDRIEITPAADFTQKISHLLESARNRHLDKIALSTHDGLVFILLSEIIRLESDGNYTTFHVLKQERFTATYNLKEFEEMLPEESFFRTHQSHIINLHFVKKVLREDGGYALMEDGYKVPIARRRKDDFLDLLKRGNLF